MFTVAIIAFVAGFCTAVTVLAYIVICIIGDDVP